MEIFIIIIIMFIIFYMNSASIFKQTPQSVYLNMNMRDLCQKADCNLDDEAKKNIDKLQKDYNKQLDACQKKYYDAKKRGDDLYLKYADDEPTNIDYLYHGKDDYPLHGDDKLMYKMYDMGQKNKQSLLNRAIWNKNNLIPYFEEELRDHADSLWYDDDSLENEF